MSELQSSRSELSRYRSVLATALALLSAFALLARWTAVAQPLGTDQSLWASAALGLSRGQLLYRDVWEQRPPGIYLIYVAGFKLFGWAASTVAWLDCLAAGATTLLVWAVARSLGNRLTAGTAAALYAVLTMPAWLYGHGGILERSVCETFIVVAVGFGAWCAVRFRERPSLAYAFAIGLSAGAAVVLKPNAAVYFPALVLWVALYRGREDRTSGGLARPLAVGVLGAAVIPALALAWLWRLGLLGDARTAVIDFNRHYVAQGFTVGRYALEFSKAVWLRIKTDPLWFAGSVGALAASWELARRRRVSPLAGLGILWGGASAIAIVVNGARLFSTYFIQAFAPLALLSAWLFGEFARGTLRRRMIAVATGVVMIGLLVGRQYPTRVFTWALADLGYLRGATDRAAYLERFGGYDNQRGYSARANDELARYVHEHTAPEDRVFLFGISGAGVYFASDRLTAHPFLRVNFFVATDFPNPRFRLEPVAGALMATRPRYLIFERLHSVNAMGKAVDNLTQEQVIKTLLGGYRFEKQIEDFTLFRLLD